MRPPSTQGGVSGVPPRPPGARLGAGHPDGLALKVWASFGVGLMCVCSFRFAYFGEVNHDHSRHAPDARAIAPAGQRYVPGSLASCAGGILERPDGLTSRLVPDRGSKLATHKHTNTTNKHTNQKKPEKPGFDAGWAAGDCKPPKYMWRCLSRVWMSFPPGRPASEHAQSIAQPPGALLRLPVEELPAEPPVRENCQYERSIPNIVSLQAHRTAHACKRLLLPHFRFAPPCLAAQRSGCRRASECETRVHPH